MIHGRNLPLNLWAEAVGCAVYLLNRTTSSQTPNKSPLEIWSGEKPNLQHLKIFGSYGYVHVPDVCRTKLERKSTKMILVGYENQNYRMYDLDTKKIKISRDVVFDESEPVSRYSAIIGIDEPNSELADQSQTPMTTSTPTSPQSQTVVTLSDDSLRSCDDEDATYEPSQEINETSEISNINLRPRINRHFDAYLPEYCEPSTYEEAMSCPESVKWKIAIEEELKAHEENKTWSIIDKANFMDKKASNIKMGVQNKKKQRW